jgi:hypothetical protein
MPSAKFRAETTLDTLSLTPAGRASGRGVAIKVYHTPTMIISKRNYDRAFLTL